MTGKYGVKLWFYAAAVFIFGALNLYLGVIAVAAFAIIAEKDKWLSNQVIQALLLYLLYCLCVLIIDWTIGGLGDLFDLVGLFVAANIIEVITDIIKDIIFVVYLVFVVIAIFRCMSGKNGVFFLSNLSEKIVNISDKKTQNKENDDTKTQNDDNINI